MRIFTAILVFLLASQLQASQGEDMNSYQQGISQRRVAEAHELWATMKADGFTENTVAALDFSFFSNSETEARELMNSLSENYTLELSTASEPGYFLIKGTTRPYGNEFTQEQWLGWVEYMVSTGFSHNAVFSTWSVYDPASKSTWSSESIEAE
ncbi:hypothetical protein [Pseudomonas leptonychotis]|uniref:hypothetical protein n=1 Tax=Pseudomonas leptonychotis TaxID=2448482 RepID=UPI0039F088FE